MKNLRYFPDSCINVYDDTVTRKRDAAFRTRIAPLYPTIKTCFSNYYNHFVNNRLEQLVPEVLCTAHSLDLLNLYAYQSKAIRSVRKKIDDEQIFKITSTCQHCTINSVNSMDHFLAKSTYPEFAVHPYNLLPSCTECNGYKGTILITGGVRRFLNLYLDQLPEIQYLFLNIFGNDKSNMTYEFELRNNGTIDPVLFAIIKNHYADLKLFKRMRLKSIEYLSELVNSIEIRKTNLSLNVIVDEIAKTAQRNQQAYGVNHFKYVLEIALVQSPVFMNGF